jgi:hypothetical protein
LLFASGAAWQTLHWLSESAPTQPNAAPWLMRIHGAAAMAALVILGTLIPLHLRRGWIARRNRFSGVAFTCAGALLVVTGYALYYVGSESLREWSSYTHVALGLAAPLALLWHIWLGRRSRNRF